MNIVKIIRCLLAVVVLYSISMVDNRATAQESGENSAKNYIVISKEQLTLTLYNERDEVIVQYPVAVGKNFGDKQRIGDYRTPEGEFQVRQVLQASNWGHDFGDGLGFIENCYGNWFIRLHTPPHTGIGIHGTHLPESVGTRATEGGVRLRNEDLDALRPYVELGMRVVILPSQADLDANRVMEAQSSEGAEEVVQDVKRGDGDKAKVEAAGNESQKSVAEGSSADQEEVWHTVANGDLVSKIAYRYGTTVSKIRALNPNINIDRIAVGQRIKVKGTPAKGSESKSQAKSEVKSYKEVWYTVQKGDYIGKIAHKQGTTVAKIKELNPKLNVDRITVGQRIRVK